jgi:hypothetical protein
VTTPPPQQPPPQQSAAADVATATVVAGVLAVVISPGDAVAQLAPAFARQRISAAALGAALAVVMSMPPGGTGFYGPATSTVARLNLVRRAQFVLASARRVQTALVAARSNGTPLGQALADAVTAERRYYGQHLMAGWNRETAAARVDSEAMTHGLLLGWYTRIDARTSRECLAADRHNFRADQMPAIGYPGMVHPHCRCLPGPPLPGAQLLGSRKGRGTYGVAA